MNWTKKVLAFSIVFFLSLLLLKGFDLAVGYDKELSGNNLYLYDAVHLNTQGSIVVAEYIANEMAKKYPEFYRLN
ncbi:hypothetical protein N9F06_01655 [Gammaproteobacteria bacterium]|nr:hypothetical protein [Gammaproteobacteria bacterium]